MDRRAFLVGGGYVAIGGLTGCVGLLDRSADDGDPVRTDQVVIPGRWEFEPPVIQVETGTAVTWRNEGSMVHTVTFDDPIDRDLNLEAGDSISLTFTERGTYEYYCRFHLPDMTGTVVVK